MLLLEPEPEPLLESEPEPAPFPPAPFDATAVNPVALVQPGPTVVLAPETNFTGAHYHCCQYLVMTQRSHAHHQTHQVKLSINRSVHHLQHTLTARPTLGNTDIGQTKVATARRVDHLGRERSPSDGLSGGVGGEEGEGSGRVADVDADWELVDRNLRRGVVDGDVGACTGTVDFAFVVVHRVAGWGVEHEVG